MNIHDPHYTLKFLDFPGFPWPERNLYKEIVPLFQNEASRKTFYMKMSFICVKINLLAELNFKWMDLDTETKDSSEMAYYNI